MAPPLSEDLKSLTAFRFFAAFWVFLFHLRSRVDYQSNWFWDTVENGARGVDFFFILSGFVIFHVYERQIISGTFSFRSYIVKRLARIYPLHLAILTAFVGLALVGGHQIQGVFASLFLVHAWGFTEGLVPNRPSWTLSAEMFAYLLFGLIVFRTPPTWLIALAFIVSAICVHLFAVSIGKTAFLHMTWEFGSLRILPLFILGMLLRRLMPFVTVSAAVVIGLAGLVLFVWFTRDVAGYEILLSFALLIVAGARLSASQILPTNSKPFVYLGEISYSIYMNHMLAILIFFDYLPKLGISTPSILVICAAVILVSAVTYHLIEVPARRRINGYAASPR